MILVNAYVILITPYKNLYLFVCLLEEGGVFMPSESSLLKCYTNT